MIIASDLLSCLEGDVHRGYYILDCELRDTLPVHIGEGSKALVSRDICKIFDSLMRLQWSTIHQPAQNIPRIYSSRPIHPQNAFEWKEFALKQPRGDMVDATHRLNIYRTMTGAGRSEAEKMIKWRQLRVKEQEALRKETRKTNVFKP